MRKEMLVLLRDPSIIGMTVFLPIMQVIILTKFLIIHIQLYLKNNTTDYCYQQ